MDCYCDYDSPEWSRRALHRSRKPRKCEECAGRIRAGERYEYVVGKWDGDIATFTTCERCVDLRQWASNNLPCLCWSYGRLDGDIAEAIAAATSRAPDETVGLRFGFLRRKVMRARFNSAQREAA